VFKEEKYEINPASIGITEQDGDGTNFKDIWSLRVPLNIFILLKPGDYVALYLIGDDGYEMPKSTRVRVVRRDVANEDAKPVLPEVLYQLVKDFIDRNKLMKLPIGATVGPEEHIVVQVAGKDCLGLYPIHIADDTTNVVTSADATDLSTLVTLINEIKADYNAHRVATAYHLVADDTNSATSADAVVHSDWAASTAYSLGNFVKPTTINAFCYECTTAGTSGTTEPTWPTTPGNTVTDNTAVWTCRDACWKTLVNEIKGDVNAHRTQAGVHPYNDNINVITSGDATDLASSTTLGNEEKTDYNAHRTCGEEGVGDVDASESYFKIVTTRRRKTL